MKKKSSARWLERHHTGKIRHHRHTSYGSLALILLLAVLPLFVASRTIASAESSYGTYAVVPGKAPKDPPTITSPANASTFTSADPIDVSGSCSDATLVKIFKNEVLAGTALCQNSSYQVSVMLFVGTNTLVARSYNATDDVSPDSAAVTVQLTLPGGQTGQLSDEAGNQLSQLFITSEANYRGSNTGQTMTWPLLVGGGLAPYAVNVSWGDGKTDLFSRAVSDRFEVSHVYDKPPTDSGSYTIIVKATDQAGNRSMLQLAAIVNGSQTPVGVTESVTGGYSQSTVVRVGWQLLVVSAIVVFSFWLGERRELSVMKKSNRTRTA